MPSKSREVEFSRGIYREWFLCSSACFLNWDRSYMNVLCHVLLTFQIVTQMFYFE
jgi:hypothetical protein